jgi:hypothetical protein
MRYVIPLCAVLALTPTLFADEVTGETTEQFHDPVQVMAGGEPIAVESPGFACPTLEDVDGDGLRDLVVGQFKQGKLSFFKNVGTASAPKFEKGVWLMSGDEPALVPDVW